MAVTEGSKRGEENEMKEEGGRREYDKGTGGMMMIDWFLSYLSCPVMGCCSTRYGILFVCCVCV